MSMFESGMLKDSFQTASAWETANYVRTMQLNDMLDACPDMSTKRTLFKTFTIDEQNGLMPEYHRRWNDRKVPVGSLVKSKHLDNGIFITTGRWSQSVTRVRHAGLAIVLGTSSHGDHMRYLMLLPPLTTQGERILFAEANMDELEVVQ